MAITRTKRQARAAALVLLAAFVCVSAQKRITVPGSFPTIQAALNEAVEGDTVYVRNGVYYENITMSDDVVLLGHDKKATIIDGRRKGPVVTGADGAVISGFTIRNGRTGILCKNTRPVIMNNIIIDNKGTGIHALVSLPEIVNNVVYRNEWTGIFLESVRGTRTSINHNVIMENGYSGIFGANRTEVLIRNNILAGNKQYGVFLGPDARKTRIVGNNIYANRLPFNDNADNQTIRQQNISEDPNFVSAGFPLHNYTAKSGRGRGEEGADIGLNESMTMAAASSSSGGLLGGGSASPGDLDQFFGTPASSPAADVPWEISETVILTEDAVAFGYQNAELQPSAYPILDELIKSLLYYTNSRFEIAGHTDNQNDYDYSMTLSQYRADAVLNYFVSRGVASERLYARGYGMSRPMDSNDTESGRAGNRRVELIPLR
ncbi:MAG: OmpA family protein [Chitinispirillia bacterium]|nr:OmpA family protein [Chitinispirillia bacterium]MCL2241775.1 OmpA family protein [Chitinispirillia bacterium]